MLKNSKIGCNCIIQVIIGYYNWIFLISVVLSLMFVLFVVVVVVVFMDLKPTNDAFSENSPVYMDCSKARTGHSQYTSPMF